MSLWIRRLELVTGSDLRPTAEIGCGDPWLGAPVITLPEKLDKKSPATFFSDLYEARYNSEVSKCLSD